MSSDLLIKINADAKNVTKEFDKIRKESEDLEKGLNKAAFISGVAFAALTAEVFLSVKAFEASDKATRTLSNALQNQGIFTQDLVKEYRDYASAVQTATGLDDDAVVSAQARAQSFLGQTKVTKELTFAIADLAESMGGDLNAAADVIGKTIGTSTNALKRSGLEMSATATEAEKMAKVLEFVNTKAGGLATAANQGLGGVRGLSNAFGDLQEAIGARFAPAIGLVISAGTKLFTLLAGSSIVADFAAAFIAAGIAVSGVALIATVAVPAFLAIKAAAAAAAVSVGAVALPFVLAAAAIFAVVAAVTLLALNWDSVMAAVVTVTRATVSLVSELFGGMAKIIKGAFTLDLESIKAGFAQIAGAQAKSALVARTTYAEITESNKKELDIQKADLKKSADDAEAVKRFHQANVKAIEKAGLQLLKLQNENASADIIALKTKEIEILKVLDSDKSASELAFFKARKAENQALQDEQNAEDLERAIVFRQIEADAKAEAAALGLDIDTTLRSDRIAELRENALIEKDIDRQLKEDLLEKNTSTNNQFLLDQKKHGIAFATINKVLNSDEVTAAKGAADGLVALSQSKNSALKSIGKAAAITQIGIDTAKGALAVYANFQTAIPFPPISIPLGIAAAGAIVAFGAEKVKNVTSAQDGGLIEGGIAGRDSVPALLEPGELVVPRKNFADVVGSVQSGGGGSNSPEILAALQSIDQKISNPQTTIIQGDVTSDDSYIDSLVRRISDAIEFRNAQIFGVTS